VGIARRVLISTPEKLIDERWWTRSLRSTENVLPGMVPMQKAYIQSKYVQQDVRADFLD
jgi:hypothetical protein